MYSDRGVKQNLAVILVAMISLLGGMAGAILAGGLGYLLMRDRDSEVANKIAIVGVMMIGLHATNEGISETLRQQLESNDGLPDADIRDEIEDEMEALSSIELSADPITCDPMNNTVTMTIENTGTTIVGMGDVTLYAYDETGEQVMAWPDQDWTTETFAVPEQNGTVQYDMDLEHGSGYQFSATISRDSGSRTIDLGSCIATQ